MKFAATCIFLALSCLLSSFFPIFLLYATLSLVFLTMLKSEERGKYFRYLQPFDMFGPLLVTFAFLFLQDLMTPLEEIKAWNFFQEHAISVIIGLIIVQLILKKLLRRKEQ